MNAKNFGFPVVSMLLVAILLTASAPSGRSETLGKDDFKTLSGKIYRKVLVIQVDPDGFLFRHRDGAAKVSFDDVSEEVRQALGYKEAAAAEFEAAPAENPPAATSPTAAAPETSEKEWIVTIRTRTLIYNRAPQHDGGCRCGAAAACGNLPWLSRRSRDHRAHVYASFPCRQIAKRELLINSGIIPVPRGVIVRRYPTSRWR